MPGRNGHGLGKPWTQGVEMTPITAIGQQAVGDLPGQLAAAEAGGECEIGETLDPVAACDDEPAPQRCRERL